MCFQARAKHDMTNTVVAGCATGGTLSAKGNFFIYHLGIFSMYKRIPTCKLMLDKILLLILPRTCVF